VDLSVALNEINTELQKLCSEVDDTLMAASSEAIEQGTEVYTYVKAAAKKKPGLKPLVDQLGARFVKTKKVKKLDKAA
jgi:hypothetical protein